MSVPFRLLGWLSGVTLPAHLPVSALMFVCPLPVTLVLLRWREGPGAPGRLLARLVGGPGRDHRVWHLPSLLLVPVLMLLAYLLTRLFGRRFPEWDAPLPAVLVFGAGLLVISVVASACAETAWRGSGADRVGYLNGGRCRLLAVLCHASSNAPTRCAESPDSWC